MRKPLRISRAKFENITYLTFNIVNIIAYLLVFIASITKAQKEGTIAEIIQAIYCTMITSFLMLYEFLSPAWAQLYFGFLCLHRGKGILMLFLGCLIMCQIAFNIIVAIIMFTIGLIYIIISLLSSLSPPNSFIIHWQNHKDFWAEGLDLPPIIAQRQPVIFMENPDIIVKPSMSFIQPENYHRSNNTSLLHPSAWHPSSSRLNSNSSQSSVSPRNNRQHLCVY
ncbi:MAG: COPI associated protein-domain-containing protein [Benjaminiella poitrasii]|nr:MAG: COPI associated protein-domain-containing protein [Benjaminiella poitrasii]